MYRGTQSLNKMFNATGLEAALKPVDTTVIVPTTTEREPSGVVIDDRGPLNIQQVDITESTTTVSENVPTVTTTTFGGGGAMPTPIKKTTEVLPAPTATKQSYFTTKNIIIAVVVIVVLVAAFKYFKKAQ